jgi:hypothetical protein
MQHLLKPPGEHGRGADIKSLTRADDVVQRFERFFKGCVVIEAMNLVEIYVIRAEAAQAVIDGVKDMFPREALLVGIVAHYAPDFCSDDDFVARGAELFESAPGDLFAHA